MTVYYEDGTEETVTNNVDEGTWETSGNFLETNVIRRKERVDFFPLSVTIETVKDRRCPQ